MTVRLSFYPSRARGRAWPCISCRPRPRPLRPYHTLCGGCAHVHLRTTMPLKVIQSDVKYADSFCLLRISQLCNVGFSGRRAVYPHFQWRPWLLNAAVTQLINPLRPSLVSPAAKVQWLSFSQSVSPVLKCKNNILNNSLP